MANGYGLYFLVIAALMSILLVTRHTRLEEQTGRAELVRASVVGRYASLTATLIVALITNVVAALTLWLLMVAAGGYGTAGSLLFVTSIAATGLAFAGVTVITVQLSEYSRVASSMAGGVLGIAFVLRAGGDMAELGGNTLSWLSPLGWAQQTAPFVLDRWWPLFLVVAFAVVTAALGFFLAGRRDLGAGFLSVRPGRSHAKPWLGTPLGLAWRLQRASIIGWAIALAVAGFVFGAYTDGLLDAMGDLPEELLAVLGADDLVAGYLGTLALFMAFLVASYAILAVQSLRSEEAAGRLELVLAASVGRTQWLAANVLVTTIGVVVLMALTGVATGTGAAIVTGDGGYVGDLLAAHVNQVPAVLVVLAVAVALFGLWPKVTAVAWILIGYGLVVGVFGPMLDLPESLSNLSPFTYPAQLPVESFEVVPVIVLVALAALMVIAGFLGIRRREIDLH